MHRPAPTMLGREGTVLRYEGCSTFSQAIESRPRRALLHCDAGRCSLARWHGAIEYMISKLTFD
eukprot:2906268-Prymnesium_polylepis.1